jgi:type VI secretion system ImpJ/VasE family protein
LLKKFVKCLILIHEAAIVRPVFALNSNLTKDSDIARVGAGNMAEKNKVAWREGIFLRPQHFQAQDRHNGAQLRARISSIQPWEWGIISLSIDSDLAELGKFSVSQCTGVMPDGTPFSIPEDMPPPPPLDVPADSRDAIISLTLPANQDGAIEFAEVGGPRALEARFLVDEKEVVDAFSDERDTEPLEFAYPNLRFGITVDQVYGRLTLGLARVREVSNKKLLFDNRYIPPSLDIDSGLRLSGALSDIMGRATQRADELAIRAVEATDGGAETFVSFLLLQALNRWIPVLQHLDALPTVHPERLYETFVSLAGELGTLIRPDRRAPEMPRYDHLNPQICFDPVVDLLQSMLSAVFERSAVQMPLENAGPGAYVSKTADHGLYKTGYFYLAVSAAAPVDEIRSLFPSIAKIASVQNMRKIVDSALPGVPLRHTPTPPPQLRVLPGYVYFELDRGVAEWKNLQSAPAVGLHVAGDWPELKLEYWCVKRADR